MAKSIEVKRRNSEAFWVTAKWWCFGSAAPIWSENANWTTAQTHRNRQNDNVRQVKVERKNTMFGNPLQKLSENYKYTFEVVLAYFEYFHFMQIYTLTITIISYYYSTRSGIYIVCFNPVSIINHFGDSGCVFFFHKVIYLFIFVYSLASTYINIKQYCKNSLRSSCYIWRVHLQKHNSVFENFSKIMFFFLILHSN